MLALSTIDNSRGLSCASRVSQLTKSLAALGSVRMIFSIDAEMCGMTTNRKQAMTKKNTSSAPITEIVRLRLCRSEVYPSSSSILFTRMFSTKANPPPMKNGVRIDRIRMKIFHSIGIFCNP